MKDSTLRAMSVATASVAVSFSIRLRNSTTTCAQLKSSRQHRCQADADAHQGSHALTGAANVRALVSEQITYSAASLMLIESIDFIAMEKKNAASLQTTCSGTRP